MNTIIDFTIVALLVFLVVLVYEYFKLDDRIPPVVLDIEEAIRRILKWVFTHIIKPLGKKLVELFGKLIELLGELIKYLKSENEKTAELQRKDTEAYFRKDMGRDYKKFSDAVYQFGIDYESILNIKKPASSSSVRLRTAEKICGNYNNVVFRYKFYWDKPFNLIHKQSDSQITIKEVQDKLREELGDYAEDVGYQFNDVLAYEEDETNYKAPIIIEVQGVCITPEEAQRRNRQNWQNWY